MRCVQKASELGQSINLQDDAWIAAPAAPPSASAFGLSDDGAPPPARVASSFLGRYYAEKGTHLLLEHVVLVDLAYLVEWLW